MNVVFSPCANFHFTVVRSFQNAIESPLSGEIEQVVEVYIHAVTARYPQARYVVGTDAKVLLFTCFTLYQ